jgi:hypothetical protein
VDKSQIVDNKAKAQDIKVQIPNSQRFTLDAVKLEMQAFVTKQMAHYKKEFPAYLRIYEQGVATYQSTLRTSQDTKEFKLYKEYIAQIRKGYDPVTMKEMVIFCNKYELARIVPALQQKDKEAFKNARSVVKYYNLKVQGEALGRVLGRLRAECHVEMVPHCKLEELVSNSAKKTVIFTDYTEALRAAEVYMKAQGFKPLVVYGETNHDLKNIVAKFESDPKANPLIATFKSLSTAVPLVMANTVVLLNSPFRAHDYEQATSRVDRIGQDTPVRIFNTYLDTGDKPNISTRSQEIMQWSKDQIEKMFSNDSILGNVAVEALVDFAEEFALESYFIRPLQAPAWASW